MGIETNAEVMFRPFKDGDDHLDEELRWLALTLGWYVRRLREHLTITSETFLGLQIPDDVVDAVIDGTSVHVDAGHFDRSALDGRIEASNAADVFLPLADFCSRFECTHFERSLVILAIAPAVDSRWGSAIAYSHNDSAKRWPTLELASAMFSVRRSEIGAPGSRRIFRDGWLSIEDSKTPLNALVSPSAELVDWVLDRQPVGRTPAVDAKLVLSSAREGLAQVRERGSLVLVRGRKGLGQHAAIEQHAKSQGRAAIASNPSEPLDALARRCELARAWPMVCDADELIEKTEDLSAIRDLSARGIGPVFVLVEEGRIPEAREIELKMPDARERAKLWARVATELPEDVRREVAEHFALTPLQIQQAAGKLDGMTREDVFRAARETCVHHLDDLGSKVSAQPRFEDLVVPTNVEEQLREVIVACKQRHRVMNEWGFAKSSPYGRGTYALLAGPSGTGKTFAASAIAAELGVELYKIDLATVVSKYIGETEKNLDRVFKEAAAASAALLFDEADAMFGARGEVSDARDRYANMEVSFLLQRMEEHEGVVFLTTNLRKNIDDAFARRIAHVIELPFPDVHLRERLYNTLLPSEAPVDPALDFAPFAKRFELTGGNIKNVLLAAAWKASDEDVAIGAQHVLHGVSRELQKLGKMSERAMLSESDLGQ